MTFFGSSANDACFNAWLTDVTDETNRGAAEGINSMMPLMAILVVFGGFMSFDLSLSESWVTIFNVIGIVVIAIGVLGIFLIQEPKVQTEENQKYFANIFYGFRPSVVKKNPVLYLTFIAFAVFNIAIQIFMPYLILYYTESLKMANYVLIMAPAILLAGVFTAVYGRMYDRKGFKVAVIPTIVLLMAGFAVLYLFKNTALVFIGSLLMMSGYLGGMGIFGAMVRDHTPQNKAGMFQGQRIIGQVLIPGVIGPAIGALVLKNAEIITNSDGTQSFLPNENIFLAALLAALVLCVSLIPLVKKPKSR
jgi:MFS family permease